MFKFSSNSIAKLNNCHKDLQIVANEALKYSDVDFKITYGYRTPQEQFELFKIGRKIISINPLQFEIVDKKIIVTNCDGTVKISKHNFYPALAFDYAVANAQYLYDREIIIYLAGVIMGAANRLLSDGKIKSNIVWGGNFNDNAIILRDENFVDLPHIQANF